MKPRDHIRRIAQIALTANDCGLAVKAVHQALAHHGITGFRLTQFGEAIVMGEYLSSGPTGAYELSAEEAATVAHRLASIWDADRSDVWAALEYATLGGRIDPDAPRSVLVPAIRRRQHSDTLREEYVSLDETAKQWREERRAGP